MRLQSRVDRKLSRAITFRAFKLSTEGKPGELNIKALLATFSESMIKPLKGVKVLELAGLAPVPFCGMMLSDFGADVVRVDYKAGMDNLCRGKRSIKLNLKDEKDRSTFTELIKVSDVLLDPYRPGVLEKMGFDPAHLVKVNPRVIIARLSGFRRQGKYANMAGHDVNYLAVSGILSYFGRKGERPFFPGNLMADFAGGGMVAFIAILLQLMETGKTGKGGVLNVNMVDGVQYLATFLRLSGMFDGERGTNLLDGGAPFYEIYETKDGQYMSVGALEPQFYQIFIDKLFEGIQGNIPDRTDNAQWPLLSSKISEQFKSKTRKEWEEIFDGSDACVAPVKSFAELEDEDENEGRMSLFGEEKLEGDVEAFLEVGEHTKEVLDDWLNKKAKI